MSDQTSMYLINSLVYMLGRSPARFSPRTNWIFSVGLGLVDSYRDRLGLRVLRNFLTLPFSIFIWLGRGRFIFVLICHRKVSDAMFVGETVIGKVGDDLKYDRKLCSFEKIIAFTLCNRQKPKRNNVVIEKIKQKEKKQRRFAQEFVQNRGLARTTDNSPPTSCTSSSGSS